MTEFSSTLSSREGGFDNVPHPVLLDRLTSLGTPSYLVSLSVSFISNRSITLVYPGAPNISVPVSVGVPQGSSISPLFFVIYVAPLHAPDGISFSLSYVDDFSLTVASTSYEQNSSKLIAAFDSLAAQGLAISVPFAPEKTEDIHWETYRQRSPPPLSPIQLGGQLITPSARVRWLGFWFDRGALVLFTFKRERPAQQSPSDLSAPSHRQPRASFLRLSATSSSSSFAPASSMVHRSSPHVRLTYTP